MTGTDELVPEPVPGPRVRNPFGRLKGTGACRCGICPIWNRGTYVCKVRACHQDPKAQACRYGAMLIERRTAR